MREKFNNKEHVTSTMDMENMKNPNMKFHHQCTHILCFCATASIVSLVQRITVAEVTFKSHDF